MTDADDGDDDDDYTNGDDDCCVVDDELAKGQPGFEPRMVPLRIVPFPFSQHPLSHCSFLHCPIVDCPTVRLSHYPIVRCDIVRCPRGVGGEAEIACAPSNGTGCCALQTSSCQLLFSQDKPAVAQLVEHLAVDLCSDQMLAGSIPVAGDFLRAARLCRT